MKITKKEIIDEIKDVAHEKLYRNDLVASKALDPRTTDTGEFYYDVIAEFLVSEYMANGYKILENIERIDKADKTYYQESHKELTAEERNSIGGKIRGEEWLARSLLGKTYNTGLKGRYIGTVIDYQVSLKGHQDDGAGKIDLLTYYSRIMYIIEFKREDNQESLLRAVLEAYTYYKQVDIERLKSEYSNKFEYVIDDVRPGVLVFAESRQHGQAKDSQPVRTLAHILGVEIYIIEEKQVGDYKINEFCLLCCKSPCVCVL
jgi:hypothetical protein